MIKEIGHHRVRCGNLLDGIDDLMSGDIADLIYSDPPWGDGNLKYWETMRMKMTGSTERRDNPLDKFFDALFSVIKKYARNVVLIEYGKKWESQLIDLATTAGLQHHKTIETLYKSGSKMLPMHLHVFSKHGLIIPEDFENMVHHTHGWDTILNATKAFSVQGGILLDPCCGLGYSARVAMTHGMRFRGNELNPVRLAKTIGHIERSVSSRR